MRTNYKRKQVQLLLIITIGLVLITSVYFIVVRAKSESINTSSWQTLTNTCIAGAANDSPTSIANGLIAGKPFSVNYPANWKVVSLDHTNCSAIIVTQPASAIVSINSYGFIEPFSFKESTTDYTYQANGLTIRQQMLKNIQPGKNAIVNMLLKGDHVEGIITLEYSSGLFADDHYKAIDSAIIDSFVPKS